MFVVQPMTLGLFQQILSDVRCSITGCETADPLKEPEAAGSQHHSTVSSRQKNWRESHHCSWVFIAA